MVAKEVVCIRSATTRLFHRCYCSRTEIVPDSHAIKTVFNPNTCRANFHLHHMLCRGEFSLVPKLFDEMSQKNSVSTNLLLSSYAKSGNLSKARKVFDDVANRSSAVAWTIMIGAYARNNQHLDAFRLYSEMHRFGRACPDYVTFSTLLSGCDHGNFSVTGREIIQVHTHIVKLGLDTSLMVCNSLINSYCKCHCLHLALGIFDQMPTRDSVTFNAMITGYAKDGMDQQAINLFEEMRNTELKPTDYTFAAVLYSATNNVALGQLVHGSVIKTNYSTNVFVGNALLDFYKEHELMDEASKLFDEMPELDCVSYNIIITGYVWNGQYKLSLDLFGDLQCNRFVHRRQLPFATMLNMAGSAMHLKMGQQIHTQAIVTTAISETHVGNSLVDMYAKCDMFEEAATVFANLSCKDAVSWTALISSYVQKGLHEEGLKLFNNMHRSNVRPDEATFASVLKASSNLGSFSLGKQLHSLTIRSGFMASVFCGSTLVDMYAKCGSIKSAIQTFHEMPDGNIVSWNALISAHAQNGDGEATLQTFEQMVELSLRPDSISFLSVLTACSHRGLVEEGLKYFNYMVNDFSLVPKREHYATLIDMLCRRGHFSKVDKLMAEMPFEPDEVMWSSVLNSCRIHKNEELAKKAVQHLFNMSKLRDGASYITMSNVHAELGQWENVGKVKKAMRDRGVRKVPAYSWVEIENKVHVFSSNDKVHPQIEVILKKIDALYDVMEKDVYEPDLNFWFWLKHLSTFDVGIVNVSVIMIIKGLFGKYQRRKPVVSATYATMPRAFGGISGKEKWQGFNVAHGFGLKISYVGAGSIFKLCLYWYCQCWNLPCKLGLQSSKLGACVCNDLKFLMISEVKKEIVVVLDPTYMTSENIDSKDL